MDGRMIDIFIDFRSSSCYGVKTLSLKCLKKELIFFFTFYFWYVFSDMIIFFLWMEISHIFSMPIERWYNFCWSHILWGVLVALYPIPVPEYKALLLILWGRLSNVNLLFCLSVKWWWGYGLLLALKKFCLWVFLITVPPVISATYDGQNLFEV